MNRLAAVAAGAAALACGAGSPPPRTAPPVTTPPPAPATAQAVGPITYRITAPLSYVIERRDSLSIASGGGIQVQASAKRAVVTVRPGVGKGTIEVSLDSLATLGPAQVSPSAIDSAVGTIWRGDLSGRSGPWLTPNRKGVLVGQIGQTLELLFVQLPQDGARQSVSFTNSFRTPLEIDAFESEERGTRTSRVTEVAPSTIVVEFVDELSREGTANQGGQLLRISGTGKRAGSARVRVEGRVERVELTESDELVVTQPAGAPVPVRQITSIRISLRDSRAR
jgi:hypothetical protein